MDLRHHLDILKRHRSLIVTIAVGVAAYGAVLASLRTPVYQASAQVLLRPNDPAEVLNPQNNPRPLVDDPDRYVRAQEDIIKSEAVVRLALSFLTGLTVEDVQGKVSVTQKGASDILQISATDLDPEQARDVANAVARAYIENRRVNAVAGLQRAIADLDARLQQLQARIADLDAKVGPEPPSGGGGGAGAAAGKESLRAAREAASRQYEVLFSRQQELLVDVSLKRGEAELITLAALPTAPVNSGPLRTGVLGGLVGLVLGAGVALLRDQLDDRVRSATEIERLTGLPVLAELPHDEATARNPSQVTALADPLSPLSEAVRTLRTSVHLLGVDHPARVILVTSPGHGEGKSLVAANLATAYAQAGYRTHLVSADLRRPRVASMFPDSSPSVGLTGVIRELSSNGRARSPEGGAGADTRGGSPWGGSGAGRGPLQQEATGTRTSAWAALVTTPLPNLRLLPAGPPPPNPAELLGSRRMVEVLADLADSADVVVIDSPPLLPVTDAAVLATRADAVILVTALGETRRDGIRRAATVLKSTGSRLLGTVVNKVPLSSQSYYSAYFGDSSGSRGRRRRGRKHRRGAAALVAPPIPAPLSSDRGPRTRQW